ncbi:transcription antiterminator [Lapidilactobacillus dextrinicus]|uniref:PTS sugar transporter subunit IIB n=1 Tax=Lapidilactobacillus dextrinicus TaxID=51664 RepID=UPI00070B1DF0|nr:transcription antiterminator [Lapidilactobacillus dextrinicus]QFG47418.1 transcription antiterminator [Lapidilactobacillus dextrinicus]
MSKIKIAFFCSGGMSSSLAGKHLQEFYESQGRDIQVDAYDFGMMDDVTDDANLILLAPQISWAYDDVKSKFPDKKVVKLSITEFGSMSGEKIAEALKKEGIE